ncbi:MAG: twin-arginine translocase subunit TatC [Firmicutes bacterium]|jgi:sec-independent protein translocase protein TatC|nr:twin-arginine translocase subunit TatC [Bacillota bacterium]
MNSELIIRLLSELRKRLIIMAAAVLVVAVACFCFVDQIRQLLILPGKELEMKLIYLNPSEALLADLQLSLIAAAILALPFLLYQVVALILAVARRRGRAALWLSLAMYLLFALGLAFAYFVAFPFALNFFLSFSAEDLVASFSIARYLSFATSFLLSFALIFELPLVFWFLGKIGLIDTPFLRRNRKYALLIIVILAAILTPPDVFSQILMAIPLLLLYEIGILMVWVARRESKSPSP